MKIKEALNYYTAIKNLMDSSISIDAFVKFQLLTILKQLEPTIQNFEIVRDELINKYGTTDESGRVGIFAPRKEDFESDEEFLKAVQSYKTTLDEFNKEREKITESDVDIDIKKIKCADIMNAGIPADFLIVLYNFIEE
jgi:hypothetical protein